MMEQWYVIRTRPMNRFSDSAHLCTSRPIRFSMRPAVHFGSTLSSLALLVTFCLGTTTALAQVLINEVSVKPGTSTTGANDQSLKDCGNTAIGREYIELYNPDPCNAVDIGCFILATPRGGVSTGPQGAFRFPPGTTIPPLGFVSIGGALTEATFILPTFCTGPNASFMASSLARWFLDNADHYVALYDDTGVPLDVVFWTFGANQANRWNNPTYDGLSLAPTVIPNPPSCTPINQLAGPATIPATVLNYAGGSPALGTVLHRVQDGSPVWQTNAQGTLNNCNGTCATPVTFTYGAAVTQPACGAPNGTITISTAGTGTFTYSWTPAVSTTNSASGLAAGSYEVVIELNGCQQDTTIVLAASNAPTALQVTVTDATCGADDGVLTLGNVTGGAAPFIYQINSGPFASTTVFPGLAAGTYTLTVQDANGCTFTTSATVAEAELDLVTSIRTRYEECAENGGTIEVLDVSGGTAPYLFSFGNGPFTSVTSLDGLNPGVGVIRVRDANNCEWSGSFSIPVPSADALVFAPNSFTPNGDGINDEWAISASCINEFECLIFDRWGQLISTLNAEDPQWDGTIFGQPAKPDLYVYLLNVKASFGSSDRYRGSIMLLR